MLIANRPFSNQPLPDANVSSEAYFAHWANQMIKEPSSAFVQAVREGYISSAGVGSESVVQASRNALLNALDLLPSEHDSQFSLLTVGNNLSEIFKNNLNNDRVMLPLLEVFAFLLDMQVLQGLVGTSFKCVLRCHKLARSNMTRRWRNLLSLVQKSHFKSTHVHKLHLALDVYRGLADVVNIRTDVMSKLVSMLLHPFPKVSPARQPILDLTC